MGYPSSGLGLSRDIEGSHKGCYGVVFGVPLRQGFLGFDLIPKDVQGFLGMEFEASGPQRAHRLYGDRQRF